MKLETRVEFKKFKFTAEVTTSFNHQSASVAQPPESEKQATSNKDYRIAKLNPIEDQKWKSNQKANYI